MANDRRPSHHLRLNRPCLLGNKQRTGKVSLQGAQHPQVGDRKKGLSFIGRKASLFFVLISLKGGIKKEAAINSLGERLRPVSREWERVEFEGLICL